MDSLEEVTEPIGGSADGSLWCDCGAWGAFSPLTNDADCMTAWGNYGYEFRTKLESLHLPHTHWKATAYDKDGKEFTHSNFVRRRAMCECMAKAVTK